MNPTVTRAEQVITYEPPGPVARAFLECEDFVRGIMGPFGSGKSSACVIEVLRRSAEQKPNPMGVRKTRWAIVRNSYPELKTTTIKTWFEWCPQQYGKHTQDSPIIHHVKIGDLDMEIFFMALDKPDDVKKLLSLELTGAWLNEAREIPQTILDAITGRVGRYPSAKEGGCTWSGVIMDTNPPDDQSWWYKFAELETPKGWRFFKQPGGDSKQAENAKHLPPNYYERIKAGKDEDWIKAYVKGEYAFVTEGKPVYPMFRDRIHVAPEKIQVIKGVPLIIAADFGLTPAGVIGQKLFDGRWLIIDEFIATDCGIVRFAESFRSYVYRTYPDHAKTVEIGFGDPAGVQRSSSDERTAFEIMNKHTGWRWLPAPSNAFNMRREVVVGALNRLVDGNPGILLSPTCHKLRKGFSGGYHYKFIKTGNGTQVHETPAKNEFSHCFKAGVSISTPNGERPIESLAVGDIVSTPLGPKKVLATMQNKADIFVSLSLSDGRKFECTADHPIWNGVDFVRADSLTRGSFVWEEQSTQFKNLTALNIIGNLAAILRRAIGLAENTFTARFTKKTTAQSLKGITSTIKTAIKRITGSRIWSYLALPNMLLNTVARESGLIPKELSDKLPWPKNMPPSGIVHLRAGNGTASMALPWLLLCLRKNTTAWFALKNTKLRLVPEKRDSADLPANSRPGNSPESITLPGSANGVAPRLRATSTLKKLTVVEAAVENQPKVEVYDLTVEDAHCFYANGILVSNCHDALQYLLLGGGEHNVVLGKESSKSKKEVRIAKDVDYSVFGY